VTATEPDTDIEQLLEFLRTERGFDFTGYKRASLTRRIEKRMHDVRAASVPEYEALLERNPEEFVRLFDTILINVTSFFRDKPAWDYLERKIVPAILERRDAEDQIRIWSTGCSSGEEPFTLAMVFAEAVGTEAFRRSVKIYATDVDDDALDVGRRATYDAAQVEAVPEVLRSRSFDEVNGMYVLRPDLRRSVIFGRHDLVQDPPISRIDLLVARNTLMYFDSDTQSRILGSFHFALRDDGYLFLGKSEMLAARSALFTSVDLKRRVFAKVAPAREHRPARVIEGSAPLDVSPGSAVREAGFEASPLAQLMIDGDGRLVAANQQARHLFGLSERDLGALLQDLELSYRPLELRSRIEQAQAEGHSIALREVEWTVGGEVRFADVQISPLTTPAGDRLGVAISFSDVTRYRRLQQAVQEAKQKADAAYEELQATVEELETTNEELQSTNEELETTNEELQSTNEELETMNEELQSTNEELETINDELNIRTEEFNQANVFLEAVLRSLDAGVVVLDQELRVTAWNAAAYELWGLRGDEVQGQHLMNLDIGLPVDKLMTPLRTVLNGGDGEATPVVVEATNRRGRGFTCRITVTPLNGTESVHGLILLMEAA
jgi:two-component system, chemotaxis family, CheB/CheR fusion protein